MLSHVRDTCPFHYKLCSYLSTVTLRPSNIQASLGLHQCLVALKEMEVSGILLLVGQFYYGLSDDMAECIPSI
jgi:hypothetical protein